MSEGLQFGRREAEGDYPDRAAVFGIAERDGRIALVRITRDDMAPYFDLPGGGVDAGEDEPLALIREFGEETGLIVRAGPHIVRFSQYLISNDGRPANNRCVLSIVEITGEDAGLKIEADHELVWRTPDEAVRTLRHDGHAWAVAAWLRRPR